MKIILTVGLPGSGKREWAEEKMKSSGNWVIVDKSIIRANLGGYGSHKEKNIVKARNLLIRLALDNGCNVIVVDTNLNPAEHRSISQIAKEKNATLEINDSFLKVPLDECIRRDLVRPNSLGPKKIYELYDKWIRPRSSEQKDLYTNKRRCVILDLDGVLCHNDNRRDYHDMTRVREDNCDSFLGLMVDCLNEVVGSTYLDIVISTSRDESAREDTENWLMDNCIPFRALYMRKEGDRRPSVEVKEEILETEIKPRWAILSVFEDNVRCINMYREKGLKVIPVGDGIFSEYLV